MLKKCSDFITVKESVYSHTRYSIAIPTYKRPMTLEKTLKSVLSQSFSEIYKVIIIDNNPERYDDTELLLQRICDNRITYLKNTNNVGMVNNWNQCILASDSDWVVFVHDDDVLTKECLNNLDETIQKNPNVDAVLPTFIQENNPYDRTDNRNITMRKHCFLRYAIMLFAKKNLPITANLFFDNIYGPPTCGLMLRVKSVIEFGGYSDKFIAADWDFMSRFSRKHKVMKCEKLTGIYIWAVNASMNESTMEQIRKDRIAILKNIISYSLVSKVFYLILKKDFDKKFNSKTTDQVEYSFLYNIIKKIYSVRI